LSENLGIKILWIKRTFPDFLEPEAKDRRRGGGTRNLETLGDLPSGHPDAISFLQIPLDGSFSTHACYHQYGLGYGSSPSAMS